MQLSITPPADQTPQRLKQIPLEGNWLHIDKNTLVIFADPGSEPTEHLLQEMLACAGEFRKLPCRILLFVESAAALRHSSLKKLLQALPEMEISSTWDTQTLAALHRQMQVGDLRLPFVVCADRHGNGIYADANYRIRLAQTLLEILKLI